VNIVSQPPDYLANYGPGWIAFLSRRDNFISAGIDWFSRWDDIDHVPISHVINIIGENDTVEALEPCVCCATLEVYLHNPEIALLVRKPRTQFLANVVREAKLHLGEPYNNKLIAALALSETLAGHALNQFTLGAFERTLVRCVDRPNKWICSKLGVRTLRQPDLVPGTGVLTWPSGTVKPIDLFEDTYAFEPGAIELVP
jgi:hypothetical protein